MPYSWQKALRAWCQRLAHKPTGHELGYTPMDAHRANLFLQLVSHMYTRASLVVTTNVPFEAWGVVFGGDEMIAAAILDRLLHFSHVFLISGPSYRMRGKVSQALEHRDNTEHDRHD